MDEARRMEEGEWVENAFDGRFDPNRCVRIRTVLLFVLAPTLILVHADTSSSYHRGATTSSFHRLFDKTTGVAITNLSRLTINNEGNIPMDDRKPFLVQLRIQLRIRHVESTTFRHWMMDPYPTSTTSQRTYLLGVLAPIFSTSLSPNVFVNRQPPPTR